MLRARTPRCRATTEFRELRTASCAREDRVPACLRLKDGADLTGRIGADAVLAARQSLHALLRRGHEIRREVARMTTRDAHAVLRGEVEAFVQNRPPSQPESECRLSCTNDEVRNDYTILPCWTRRMLGARKLPKRCFIHDLPRRCFATEAALTMFHTQPA
eukprot:2274448-Pleurochrysis_carterae.AAC.1